VWPFDKNEMDLCKFFMCTYSIFAFTFLYLIRNGIYIFHFGWCIWMIPLQDRIKVKTVNSHFTKSVQSKLRINYSGRDKLWFNFDKSSKVKNVNSHVTVCISAIKSGASFLLGFFYILQSVNSLVCFLNAMTNTHL
jgi:hypothetical protein